MTTNASKRIKFSISLKELSVSFEGDVQSAERMQQEITGALHTLASAQNRLLNPGQPASHRALPSSTCQRAAAAGAAAPARPATNRRARWTRQATGTRQRTGALVASADRPRSSRN